MITRRECFVLSATSLLDTRIGRSAAGATPWYASLRRCGQLNFNERDPLTLDVAAWANYWASLKIDALLVNSGGIVAVYPTRIPYHHRSEFLGSRDLFGEMVAALRARQIRSVARMDCNDAYEDALRAHLEWFEHNRDGSRVRTTSRRGFIRPACSASTFPSRCRPSIARSVSDTLPTASSPTAGPVLARSASATARVARRCSASEPVALFRQQGASRVAYFAGDVDRTLWRSGNPDLSQLLQNAIHWVRGDGHPPVTVDGAGVIELFAWETEVGYALHVLNYTNPNMTRPFARQSYAIGPRQVTFDVAPGQKIGRVRALRADRSLPFTQEGRTVRLETPSVVDHAVIALT